MLLRSSSLTAVVVPVTRRSTIGNRAFPVAVASEWNSLPSFVTSASSLSTFFQATFKDVLVCNAVMMALTSDLCLFFLSTEHVVDTSFLCYVIL